MQVAQRGLADRSLSAVKLIRSQRVTPAGFNALVLQVYWQLFLRLAESL
jgi:hypothetical protein